MSETLGLRERKKQRTRDVISEAAISLFLEHGFDKVSVAEIAAAAEVSKMTVFNYFPTKEDLVLNRFVDHFEDAGEIVRRRERNQSALDALRNHFLSALKAHDPISGLNDQEYFLRFQDMVLSTPSLRLRVLEQAARGETALAEVLVAETGGRPNDITPRIAASLISSVQRTLVLENVRRLATGATADEVYPDAVAAANRAFQLLAEGLAAVGKIGEP